jgi:TP901 family phage tail tape measure protein
MSARATVIPTIFSAVDKLTKPLQLMEASVQKFANRSEEAIARSNRRFRALGKSAFDVSKKAALVGVAIAAPLALAANEAIKFEDQMAGVSKVLNLRNGSRELGVISEQVKKTAIYLGVAATESAKLYAELAAGGVSGAELDKVARLAGEIGVAFDLSSEQAGESFVKMRNAMGITLDEAKVVSDSINHLSDKSASKAAEILDFMAQGGSGVSRTLKIAGKDMAAIGSTFISLGVSAAESATTIERFQKGLLDPKNASSKTFKGAGGGIEGMLAVLKEGMGSKDPFTYFNQFGQYGTKIMLLAQTLGSQGGLSGALKNVSDETLFYNSVQKEFENRQNTTAGKIKKLKAEVGVLAIDLGNALLPVIKTIIEFVSPLVKGIVSWMNRNKELTKTIIKIVMGAAILAFAISGVAFAVGIYSKAMLTANAITKIYQAYQAGQLLFTGKVAIALLKQAAATKLAAAATFLFTNPVGIAIVATAALATAIYFLTKEEDKNRIANKLNKDIQNAVIDATIDQRIEVEKLFRILGRTEKGSLAWNEALRKIDAIQPGVINKTNLETNAIKELDRAQKELIKTIEKRAEIEAVASLYADAVKDRLNLEQEGIGKLSANVFVNAVAEKFGGGVKGYVKDLKDANEKERLLLAKVVSNEDGANPTSPSLNQQQAEYNAFFGGDKQEMSGSVDVNLAPGLSGTPSGPNVKVNTSKSSGKW